MSQSEPDVFVEGEIFTPHCPNCGSDFIREYGRTSYDQEITGIECGPDGVWVPIRFGERRDFVEADEREGVECVDCDWSGDVGDLKVQQRDDPEGR